MVIVVVFIFSFGYITKLLLVSVATGLLQESAGSLRSDIRVLLLQRRGLLRRQVWVPQSGLSSGAQAEEGAENAGGCGNDRYDGDVGLRVVKS